MLSEAQIASIARTVIGYAAVWLVAKGYVSSDAIGTWTEAILALVVAAVHVGYIAYAQTKAKQVAAVAKMPEVKAVVAAPEIATAPSAPGNVVSSDANKVVPK